MTYGVRFDRARDGSIGASLPDLPGVGVVGKDRSEAIALLDKAVRWHVEAMLAGGEELPLPSSDGCFDYFIAVDPVLVTGTKQTRT